MPAFIVICCAAGAILVFSAVRDRDEGGLCQSVGSVTLTGTVRSLAMIQEEPAETPQSVFTLELRQPWCGETLIFAAMPGPLFCFEGDLVTLAGDYFPPTSGFPGGPIFEARTLVSCHR